VAEDGVAQGADEVDDGIGRGVGEHSGRGDELVAGGVQRDAEAAAVGIELRLGQHGVAVTTRSAAPGR
jgi:hypothetical protein